jgi:hypothetical protein
MCRLQAGAPRPPGRNCTEACQTRRTSSAIASIFGRSTAATSWRARYRLAAHGHDHAGLPPGLRPAAPARGCRPALRRRQRDCGSGPLLRGSPQIDARLIRQAPEMQVGELDRLRPATPAGGLADGPSIECTSSSYGQGRSLSTVMASPGGWNRMATCPFLARSVGADSVAKVRSPRPAVPLSSPSRRRSSFARPSGTNPRRGKLRRIAMVFSGFGRMPKDRGNSCRERA